MKYRALVTTEDNKVFNNSVQEKSLDFLPDNNTLIKVKYSSLTTKMLFLLLVIKASLEVTLIHQE